MLTFVLFTGKTLKEIVSMPDVMPPPAKTPVGLLIADDDVLSVLPHAILVTDALGQIEYANAAAENFLEASASTLTRNKLSDIFPFDSSLLALIAKVSARGFPAQEYDVEISTSRIGRRTVDTLVSPMNDERKRVLVVIHERGMADKMTRQLTHQGAARSVRAMAAILAHEIKNPLAGIRGAAQLIETEMSGGDVSLTRLIRDEADRIVKLVDKLEVFTENAPVERKPVNIHAILEHVVSLAKSSFARDVHFNKEFDPSLPDIPGDRDRLVQVLLNLVRNAVDAIQQKGAGEVTLTTAYRPGMRLSLPGSPNKVNLPLEVCVMDNGPGISPDLIDHLFDPFVTTKPNGTGLGLALVAKIVGDHGGIVDCQSKPKQTIFRLLLPMESQKGRAV